MEGDEKGGFTVFYADDGLDTGPILLTKEVHIKPNETVDTLYNRFLYPEGIKGMVKSLIDHCVIIAQIQYFFVLGVIHLVCTTQNVWKN